MKKFLIFAVSAAMIWACNKDNSAVAGVEERAELTVNICGNSDSDGSKATGVAGDETDEAKVSNVQVFVFNGNTVDGYGTIDNAKSLSISCTAGTRDIYAVVNASSLASVTTKEDFLKQCSTLQEGSFEMLGSKTAANIEAASSVSVNVDRFSSRVVVKKITNSLSSPALQSQSFEVKKIYITNVATKAEYSGTALEAASQVWKNQFGYQSANNLGALTNDDVSSGNIAHGSSYTTAHYLYGYPNAFEYVPFTKGASFSARRSLLVVRIKIGETLYDYPIVLPQMSSNKSYEIKNLIITRPGNKDDGKEGGEDEENPVTGAEATFTVNINNWSTILVTGQKDSEGNYTI